MNAITKNNYEAFLLDYVEQNLSAEMVAELMLFLEQNPELKIELEEFENTSLITQQTPIFEHKETLKQVVTEELMIAEIEGLNSIQESKELFEEIAKNQVYAKLFSNYKKTILEPIPIIFADKKSLKQKETKVIPLYWWISSAAAILLMFLLLKNFNNDIVEPLIVESSKFKVESIQEKNQFLTSPKKGKLSSPLEGLGMEKTNQNLTSQVILKKSEQVLNDNNIQPIRNEKQETEIASITYIEITPAEKEYITIEAYTENSEQPKASEKDEFLTVSELLKKEAQKRILERETKNAPTELIAANVVAKVFGKNAEVETKENTNGETEEYALNIGEFSFSRKIRK